MIIIYALESWYVSKFNLIREILKKKRKKMILA